ncbi:MAG: VOC family protein [Pseudomonadota bacterium]
MISHVTIGTGDLERALAFYDGVLGALGLERTFLDPDRNWACWSDPASDRPLFVVGSPENDEPYGVGNGQMTAFLAPSRAAVDRAHALALKAGGSDAGAPGLRPHYHPNYYGAYFRDPDGNKICVVRHQPED